MIVRLLGLGLALTLAVGCESMDGSTDDNRDRWNEKKRRFQVELDNHPNDERGMLQTLDEQRDLPEQVPDQMENEVDPLDRRPDIADRVSAHQATVAYNEALSLQADGKLAQAREEALRALRFDPNHAKARALLKEIDAQLPPSSARREQSIAEQQARVEIRARMDRAAAFSAKRDYKGAKAEYDRATTATAKLTDPTERTRIRYQIERLRQDAVRLGIEQEYRKEPGA